MSSEKIPFYGGQALIEGVLMRGTKSLAAAMRGPDGQIIVKTEKLSQLYTGNLKKIPFLRGLMALWDSIGLGTRFLTLSANVQTGEDEKLEGWTLVATIGFAFIIGVGLFFLFPAFIAQWFETQLYISSWWSNVLEGTIRLFLLIVYIWAIGRAKDIQRVFAYHGAEHKTINAYEDGAEMIPEVVEKYSMAHPRCGTGFLLSVVMLSILLFSLLGPLPVAARLISRVILIPVLAGLAYEYMRLTATYSHIPVVRWLISPNLWLQKQTTRQPDREILAVSITAFNSMLEMENPSG